jgi:hypothetical protein
MAVAGFVTGLLGLALSWIIPIVGIVLGVLGVVLGGVGISQGRRTGARRGWPSPASSSGCSPSWWRS